eukprot:1159819-Pelagomonas_calceolata.AAC.2
MQLFVCFGLFKKTAPLLTFNKGLGSDSPRILGIVHVQLDEHTIIIAAGIEKQLENSLDAAEKVASQISPGHKVQKACDNRSAKNKLVHQYSEKEHVLHLEFDCKNTCHTREVQSCQTADLTFRVEHEAGTCLHYA